MTRDRFDQAVDAVRDQEVADEAVEAARARVWGKVSDELRTDQPAVSVSAAVSAADAPIRGCADVRALFPRYRAHSLGEGREILLQDHLRGCADCRRAFAGRGAELLRWRQPVAGAAKTRGLSPLTRYAVAASLVIVAGALAVLFRGAFSTAPDGPRATLESADGAVYLIADKGQRQLEVGRDASEREWLRTPRGTRAVVRLRDGSRVEMREQTELSVSMNRRDLSVHLERGSVLVRAARRREGHLMVITDDAKVSVTGTVFSVNRGVKGTRISVLEGSVWVESQREDRTLTAGGQMTTSREIQPLPIGEEVAWSPELAQHAELLGEVAALDKKLEGVRWPGLRYGSRLLDAVPAGAVAFAALPNSGVTLDEVHRLFRERLEASPALQAWWLESGASQLEAELPELVSLLRALSEHLGDEIVVALAPVGEGLRPLILAQVTRPGLRQALEAKLPAAGDKLRVLDERALAAEVPGRPADALVLITDTLVAAAPDREGLRAALAPASGFAATPFGQRISGCYRDGVGALFAVDLEAIARLAASQAEGQGPARDPRTLLRELGADNARFLVVEQEKVRDNTQSRATVSFAGPRQGVASWLAAPAPMGSLDFVTAGASFAAAFVVKDATGVLDNLFRVAGAMSPDFPAQLQAFEQRLGVGLRAEVAAPLGNDVALAIDGPLLPIPSWKVVLEVHQPDRLIAAIEKLVVEVNRQIEAQGQGPGQQPGKELRLERGQSRGREVFALTVPGAGAQVAVRWLFADGYLVVGPTEELLHRALRVRQTGAHLRNAGRFRNLLPSDRHPNFSAVVYHDLGQAGALVGDWIAGTRALRPEQREAFERLTAAARPSLVYVYGEESEIQVASAGGFFGLGLDHFVGSAGLADLLHRQRPQ